MTMPLVKGTTTGPYLRGPLVASKIHMKNPTADSCTYSRPADTIQALYEVKPGSIMCVETYTHNIPWVMEFGISLIFPC